MPCRDYYDDHPEQYYAKTTTDLKSQVSFAESALCAAIDALEAAHGAQWIDKIDYKDAGLEREALLEWRRRHKLLDQKHRAEEKRKRDRAQKAAAKQAIIDERRRVAAQKLTAEEREALGIKL